MDPLYYKLYLIQEFDDDLLMKWLKIQIEEGHLTITLKKIKADNRTPGVCHCSSGCGGTWEEPCSATIVRFLDKYPEWIPCLAIQSHMLCIFLNLRDKYIKLKPNHILSISSVINHLERLKNNEKESYSTMKLMQKKRLDKECNTVDVPAPEALVNDNLQYTVGGDAYLMRWLRKEVNDGNLNITLLKSVGGEQVAGECHCHSFQCGQCGGTWETPRPATIHRMLAIDPHWIPCASMQTHMWSTLQESVDRYKPEVCANLREISRVIKPAECLLKIEEETDLAILSMKKTRQENGLDSSPVPTHVVPLASQIEAEVDSHGDAPAEK